MSATSGASRSRSSSTSASRSSSTSAAEPGDPPLSTLILALTFVALLVFALTLGVLRDVLPGAPRLDATPTVLGGGAQFVRLSDMVAELAAIDAAARAQLTEEQRRASVSDAAIATDLARVAEALAADDFDEAIRLMRLGALRAGRSEEARLRFLDSAGLLLREAAGRPGLSRTRVEQEINDVRALARRQR